jgi:signal peptidase I
VSLPSSICDKSVCAELFDETLRRCGSARLRVHGSSMLPAIVPGDDLLIQACHDDETQTGDLVTFRRQGRLFVHRVISRDREGRIVTQGDAVSVPDAPVGSDEFLGKVTGIRRRGEPVALKTSRLQRASAALFRRSRICSALFLKFAAL